jgi:hypothetical protein
VESHAARRAQAARDRVATLRPAPAPTAAAGRPARAGREPAALEARALLAMPWEPLLTRVETAGAEAKTIAWLGLDAAPAAASCAWKA